MHLLLFTDASCYSTKNSRRMTEVPPHSVQKYLSDKERKDQFEKTRKLSDDNNIPRKLSQKENSKQKVDYNRRHVMDTQALSSRRMTICDGGTGTGNSKLPRGFLTHVTMTEEEEDDTAQYLSCRQRLMDRRQSTPVMYLTESLNKLALSRIR